MKCPSCGRDNRNEADFCAWCGAAIQSTPETPVAVVPAVPAPTPEPVAPAEEVPPATESVEAMPVPEEPTVAPNSGDVPVPGIESIPTKKLPSPGDLPAGDPPVEAESDAAEAVPVVEVAPEPVAEATDAPEGEVPDDGPLAVGQVIGGRYRVVELVEATPEENRYRAIDLVRCPSCGHEGNEPDDAYCEECGAGLEPRGHAIVVERAIRAPQTFDERFVQADREYYVTAEPMPEPEPEPEAPAAPEAVSLDLLNLVWGQATDTGIERDHNEDYVDAWLHVHANEISLALFIVADGLGGQDSGEVASRMATESVWHTLRESLWEPLVRGEAEFGGAEIETLITEAIATANQQVYDARTARNSQMSTTITMALLLNNTAYIANVGDSRTYLWNAAGLRQITKDHSLVQRLVDTQVIKKEEIYSHPQRNLIYQCIGDRPEVQSDVFVHELVADDRLILCSDGLWEMVHDEGIEDVMLSEMDPQTACDRLVKHANLAGGEDNISVTVVRATRD